MSDSFEKWEDQLELGSGSFGTVKKVITDKGDILAAKYISPPSGATQANIREVEREVGILKQLSHKNIVQFVTVKMHGSQFVIFTEFIDGKSLTDHSPVKNQKTLNDFIKQICTGLHYMHTRNPLVLHRDIKGDNIMVTHAGMVKIIDFGISIELMVACGMDATQIISATTSFRGTPLFMAPELFTSTDRCKFSVKSDVWALGMTIYQMVLGQYPFCDCTSAITLRETITRQGAPALPDGCPKPLLDFYACCTKHQPGDRKSVRELLGHKYLTGN